MREVYWYMRVYAVQGRLYQLVQGKFVSSDTEKNRFLIM
jgi:hypothetical protein